MNGEALAAALRELGHGGLADQVEQSTGKESLKFHVNLHIELRDEYGNLKDERHEHNLICTSGKNALLSASASKALLTYTYVAIGTGATAAAITDTALQTEVARSPTQTPTNPTAASYQVVYLFPAGTGTGAITEAGLLDAASVGNLLAHQVFSVINKASTDTLSMTWTIS
jgi:hypothetical protein